MNALVAAAKKEGTLNVIALPPTWANYGAILSAFTAKYGIKINSTIPDGTSQQEVDAVKSENGTAKAPDVLDIGQAVALANTKLFAPYKVATWSAIPTAQKDAGGLWYEDYGGYMAIGYSSKFGTITSLNDLLGPKFKNAVALNGNPTSANAALNGVMMANLAQGGTASNISKGVDFFSKLKAAGNFSPYRRPAPRSRQARPRSCSTGTTSTSRATWECRTGRCSCRRASPWAGTTRRPSTRTRRTRRQPGCGRSSSTRRPRRAGRTSGSRAAPGRWSSRPCNPTAASTHSAAAQAAVRLRITGVPHPGPEHRRCQLPGGELGEGRRLARERGCRCDN